MSPTTLGRFPITAVAKIKIFGPAESSPEKGRFWETLAALDHAALAALAPRLLTGA
jgi:hypothetical protein